MLIFYLILIFTIIIIFISRPKKTTKEEEIIKEVENEERENLKQEKEIEDEKLNKKISVLCSDGVKRNYCGFMYGIIKEKKLTHKPSNDILLEYGYFEIKDFDINPIEGEIGSAYLSYFEEKWFSSEGEILEKNDIIKYRLNEIEKNNQYNFKYSSLIKKNKPNFSVIEFYFIHFINGIYYVEHEYFGRTISFDTFNGSLNGDLYVDGFLSNPNPKVH